MSIQTEINSVVIDSLAKFYEIVSNNTDKSRDGFATYAAILEEACKKSYQLGFDRALIEIKTVKEI